MHYRFTLTHSSGSQQISEPDGWKDIKLTLDRDAQYHSLIELFEVPLVFYGSNGTHDGGRNFILNVIRNYGLNEEVTLEIEVSEDETTYDDLFHGMLSLETYKIVDSMTLQCGILRDDFWSKFINREDTPVNIQSDVDLDGEAIDPVDEITINLPSQTINKTLAIEATDSQVAFLIAAEGSGSDDLIVGVGFDKENIVELQQFTSNGSSIATIPNGSIDTYATDNFLYFLKVDEIVSGTLEVQVSYRFVASRSGGVGTNTIGMRWVLQVKSGSVITDYALSDDYTGVSDRIVTDSSGNATFNKTHYLSQALSLVPGDEVYLYGDLQVVTAFGAVHGYEIYYGDHELTYITFNAATQYPDSTTAGFFIHDVAGAILDRATGQADSFYSEFLGGETTQYRQYDSNGCGFPYSLQKGLQIRNYSLTEKPFFLSFKEWWSGANPILNLGLSYDTVDENQVLRIENKEYFYNTDTSINLSWVNNIEETVDKDKIFKKVSIGYNKWQSEDIRGLDDPQTKHVYATLFKSIGTDFTMHSTYIAASLAIEITRRKTREKSADYKFDNDTFIIALNPEGEDSPANTYNPEIDENFSSIENLLNYDTRYNLKLTPKQNLLRWLNYLNGCLQNYLSSEFVFTYGEGNFDFAYQNNDACLGEYSNVELSEKGNTQVTDSYLHRPDLYEFEHPLTWANYKTIRENRNKAIGVSTTDSNHETCFIKRLEYDINKSTAKFTVWKR